MIGYALINSLDFSHKIVNKMQGQLWVDYDVRRLANNVFITGGIDVCCWADFEIYVVNAHMFLERTIQEYLFESWTVDPLLEKPFYIKDNAVSFVVDEDRSPVITVTGEVFFVNIDDYQGPKPASCDAPDLPQPGQSIEDIERLTRFQKLTFAA